MSSPAGGYARIALPKDFQLNFVLGNNLGWGSELLDAKIGRAHV